MKLSRCEAGCRIVVSQDLRTGDAYQLQLVLVRKDTPEAVRTVLSKAQCHRIVSIGSHMTATLQWVV